jgi:hypothetical protein
VVGLNEIRAVMNHGLIQMNAAWHIRRRHMPPNDKPSMQSTVILHLQRQRGWEYRRLIARYRILSQSSKPEVADLEVRNQSEWPYTRTLKDVKQLIW